MCHAVVRGDGHVVAGLDEFALGEADGVFLHDFLGERLGEARGGAEGGEDGAVEGVFELGVEGFWRGRGRRGPAPGGGGEGAVG